MLGLAASLAKGGASLLTFVKDNLKLYLDFKSSRSDTLAFPSEGSTSFDGNNYINGSTPIPAFGTNPFSISVWVYPTASGQFGIFSNSNGATGDQMFLSINATNFVGTGTWTAWKHQFSSSDTQLNTWQFLTYVREGTGTNQSKWYINGELKNTATDTTNWLTGTGWHIGSYNNTNGLYNGKLANFAVWTRSLSPEEVQSVMNKSYSQLGSVEKTSLEAWWALDSASGGVVQPATGETSEERVTNTDFNDTSGWSLASGRWTIDTSAGTVTHDGSANFSPYLSQSNVFDDANAIYKITITIDSCENFLHAGIVRNGTVSNFYHGFGITSTGTHIVYINGNTSSGLSVYSNGVVTVISQLSIKKITSNTGYVTGATTTTSVYGGNAPILPRAIDIAESQAEQIGDGSALFNGSSDYIDLGDSTDFDITNSITLSSWVNFNSTSTNVILARDDNTNSNFILYGWSDGRIYAQIRINGVAKGVDGGTYSLNAWYHVALTYDGSSLKIYNNGILQDNLPASGSIDNDDVSFEIGRKGNNAFHFDGKISQVGVWQGALSQAQIQSVMESTSYAKIPASVKSTLAANSIPTANATPSSGHEWTAKGSGVNVDVANGELTLTIPSGNDLGMQIGNLAKLGIDSNNYSVGDLYKFSYDVKIVSTESNISQMRVRDSSQYALLNAYDKLSTEYQTQVHYNVITNLAYSIPMTYRNGNVTGQDILKYKNFKAEKVTNDLVAYYPLDADSSRSNGTDDVTTGETLGDNLATVTTFANQSAYGQVNIISSSVADGNGLYKISYTVDSYTSGNFQYQSNSGTQPTPALGYTRGTSTGDKVDYIFINNAGTHFQFRAFNLGYTGSISNIQIRKVTSNTGVLL